MGVAYGDGRKLWASGLVPFEISGGLTPVARLYRAMDYWETNTNVRFIPHTVEPKWVRFLHGAGGCSSGVGRPHGDPIREVNLQPGCTEETIRHEIGHAIGLLHEQQRPDRDQTVTVRQGAPADNYGRLRASEAVTTATYDRRSLMAYANGWMTAKDPSRPLGGTGVLTTADRKFVNQLYPATGIVRRSDGWDDIVPNKRLAIAADWHPSTDSTRWLFTAAAGDNWKIRVKFWRLHPFGGIARNFGDSQGSGSEVAIAVAREIVTAYRAPGGRLQLASWTRTGKPMLRKTSGSQVGIARIPKVVAVSDDIVVSACQTQDGRLKLIAWRLATDGSLTRLSDSGDRVGEVGEIDLFYYGDLTGGDHVVVSTVRTGLGSARVYVWRVPANGESVELLSHSGNTIGAASMVRTARNQHGHIVVGMADAERRLRLVTLRLSDRGTTLTRIGASGAQVGVIRGHELLGRPYGVLAVTKTSGNTLKLIRFDQNTRGASTRRGDSGDSGETITQFAAATVTGLPLAPVVTVVRTKSARKSDEGKSRLLAATWDDQAKVGRAREDLAANV